MSHSKATKQASKASKTPPSPVEKPRKCGIYLRVSTEEQADSFGLKAQERKCRAYAESQGFAPADLVVYRDPGYSGTLSRSERPGLDRLLKDVESGKIQTVIIAALDRLARKSRLIFNMTDDIKAAGCELMSVKENIDTTTYVGEFILGIFSLLAEMERKTILERTSGGRSERTLVDGEGGGRVPYGYQRALVDEVYVGTDGKRKKMRTRVVIDAEQAAVIERIFRLKDTGLGLRRIATILNSDGIPTPRGGEKWRASSVRSVLASEDLYRGEQRNGSDVPWPIILSS